MTMKIRGLGGITSSTISCRIPMSVLMMKDFLAEASTTLIIVHYVIITTIRMIVRNSVVIMSGLVIDRTTALIAIIENKFAFMGASIEAPIFFLM
jgi:hypothetical protein